VFLTLMNLKHAVPKYTHFFMTADVASTSPRYDLGKVAFSSMFLKRKKSQRFGASSFPSFTTRQRNPFATPRMVLQRAKKSLCNRSQFRTLLLPHRLIKIRLSHQNSSRPCRPTLWDKLGQVELGQAPSWV